MAALIKKWSPKTPPRSLSSDVWKVQLSRLSTKYDNTIILGMSYSALKYNYDGQVSSYFQTFEL